MVHILCSDYSNVWSMALALTVLLKGGAGYCSTLGALPIGLLVEEPFETCVSGVQSPCLGSSAPPTILRKTEVVGANVASAAGSRSCGRGHRQFD